MLEEISFTKEEKELFKTFANI